MVKLHDLKWMPWLIGDGIRAVHNGYSIIRCPGSYGYKQGLFEVMNPDGEVTGYLSVEDVERIINEDRRHSSPNSGKSLG